MTRTFALPRSLPETFEALGSLPEPQLLAGGTDFVVEVNFGHRRPRSVVALRRVPELQGYDFVDGQVVIRAGTTYTVLENELVGELPALAAAARTVGSPQMRNAGTIGGNLGTASPAGDTLPFLAAVEATVVLAGAAGERELPVGEFVTGVKRTALRPGEVIREVRVPRLTGPQQFLKVGTRNAMVISIATCCVVVDVAGRSVRCALGSVAPVPLRATEAEQYIDAELDWSTLRASEEAVRRFGQLAAAAARPISDQRSTAEYRRHAVEVIAARALGRSLSDGE